VKIFSICVVDTNVPLVANRKSDVSENGVLVCIKQLEQIIENGCIAIDDKWLILKEYMNKLSPSGQPGIGDAFLKWVLTNKSNPKLCHCVSISYKNENSDFEEFPTHDGLAGFDISDKKFVAVSVAHIKHPPILQASDCKWWGWKDFLKECGVEVIFLCPEEAEVMYLKKIGAKKKQEGKIQGI
jgi:hypothetical protein